ncbi:ribophorin I [Actinidia rufa]|uniref:Dolichyl-diphosphooligosaccharide--protein glycosyltransferase subunit 1 n=1 Tax=Actinidia rufa TaxID=165716 RepID=A0A7J0GII6_9ERIC|nr:ribophorin I [Actinidia rufa]
MRQGFVSVHLAPGSKFDFQKYITSSLEDDFKVVVGISPLLCGSAVLYLLLNVHGLQAMFWLSIMPLIYEFGLNSCFHNSVTLMVVRVATGVGVQFFCSYITLPLYALVTQGLTNCFMGSNMKRSIFDEQTAKALKNWRKNALKKKNEGKPGPAATRKLGGSPVESPDNSPKLTHSHETDQANASSTVDIRSENPPRNDNGLELGTFDLESCTEMGIRFDLFFLSIAVLCAPCLSDLVLSKVDRRVENIGSDPVSEVLLPFPDHQAKNLAYLAATTNEGKGKTKGFTTSLPVEVVHPKGMPPALTWYSVTLPKGLGQGESLTLDVLAVFTHALRPFPEKIPQDQPQRVAFQDSAYYLSPYIVKVQLLSVKLPPGTKLESHTKLEKTEVSGSEIKYGPYENHLSFSFSPIVVHFENNQPFAVAQELVREIEISHWGNVQVTEHYNLIHGGSQLMGEFSRLEYQARPQIRGASAFRHLVAKLPPRAHSVYYRDEIGNISTSHLWGDSRKTQLEIEPRYPMFGGWKTAFTIGYGLPLKDFLFQSEGKRFLNISFGSPIKDLVIDCLIVKVVLPEGSKDVSGSVPFPVKQWHETKFSHLDMVGRPVVVLEKMNVVQEHNQQFQVYYKFNNIAFIAEGAIDWDEVQTAIQQVQRIINRCLTIHDKLEATLRDLSRTGDMQACKAARKAADGLLKELSKELKPLLAFLHSCPQAAQILPKVEELVAKERELQEKLMVKHSTVVDSYEKKSGGREIENRIASIQQKLTALRQEVEDLLEVIDEI